MVNLELYRIFYTVARCGSLTKAADELFISQPAMSQAIKQLESQLGTSLFNRTHRGMELTLQGGKPIYKKVEAALKMLEDAEHKLSALKTTATGKIKIGATDSIFAHVLADKIVAFNEKFPAVKFELITGTSLETLEQLKESKCDVGFVNLPIDDNDVNFTGMVTHLSDIFVAGNKFSKLRGKLINLCDLMEYPLLMIEYNTVARHALTSFTQSLGIRLTPDIEVANWDLMVKFACRGMGIGCVPREYVTEELESGELFEVTTIPALPVRGVGIALPKHVPVSYALREFLSLFN